MITLLGFLIFIGGITAIIISRIEKHDNKAPSWLKGVTKLHGTLLLMVGITLMLIKSLFFFADRGFNYLLVSPTGKMSAVMEQGIKWRGFAKIDKWQKYLHLEYVLEFRNEH